MDEPGFFDNLEEALVMARNLHANNCESLRGKASWEARGRADEATTLAEARKEIIRARAILERLRELDPTSKLLITI